MEKNIDRGALALGTAFKSYYDEGIDDYHMKPLVRVDAQGKPVGTVKRGDAVIFCCRRGEREIELTDAFTDPTFTGFERELIPDLDFVILTMYHEKLKRLPIAFAPSKVEMTLAQVLSENEKKQLHCSESEKFAHVTFFFNGGEQLPFKRETDIKIPSPKCASFDEKPELSLEAVANEVIEALENGCDFIVTNFANGDVIGHTDNNEAKLKCAEAVDTHLKRVVETARENGYTVAITADHGNLELMTTPEGKPHVAHTTAKVPFILMGDKRLEPKDGKLADVAPTLLELYGIKQPKQMTGKPLVKTEDKTDKIILIILDGWGFGALDATDPIHLASTPYWDSLLAQQPYSRLDASGEAVGLKDGKAGNSEAGHINLGAGRVVLQDDVRLDNAMKDGSFDKNEVFLKTIEGVRQRGTALHLIALLTKKSSHGSIDYPLALMRMAKDLPEIYVHVIFDGRSTEPGSAPALLEDFEALMNEIGAGQIVSGIGRGLALDRDGNYARVKQAYDAFVEGVGRSYN